ncbi:GNAT family N-acetyltransferase [Vitiosangium sp. GDMCC 1.1324]|uniref:GNAT family N-acetyltransferase n=1 Tax=Vitiosangium sp. (strain GDMCC 1.1324) TaxID=2138576 RepID=UPI000D3674B5|nr:hypothetical protein [Vitiosangium sp. GDMCC 1.1324]PTL83346.1 hypothetical protein DAT35_15300 [Vitiosangium sp. GDMCC 1.1324]
MSLLRRATREDNPRLLELFGAVPMQGELVLATQRSPDFFSLYDMQRGDAELWVHEVENGLDGMGAILVRDGWLEGRPCRVGYLGDLRTRFSARRSRGLARFYGPVLEETAKRLGVDVFLTSVMATNAAALQALVKRKKKREAQPHYAQLRRFSAVSVHFTRRRRPKPGRFHVRRATPGDVPAMAAMLDADHRARPFGYRYDQGELQHRLERWPGLSVGESYLAFDGGGELVGCTSVWDPDAVKRYRVMAYRGSMRWVKWGYDAMATVLRAPRLPDPGNDFRYFYLCNTSIAGEDPAILRALVEQVYADQHGKGYHFFSLYLDESDPLHPALEGFFQRRLDFHLYAVTPASLAREHFPAGRTGFEMALV